MEDIYGELLGDHFQATTTAAPAASLTTTTTSPPNNVDNSVLEGFDSLRTTSTQLKPSDPSLPTSFYLGELQWWTSDQEIIQCLTSTGVPSTHIIDITFSQVKLNGKSKGMCFVECIYAEDVVKAKQTFVGKEIGGKKCTFTVAKAGQANPFKRQMEREDKRREKSPRFDRKRDANAMEISGDEREENRSRYESRDRYRREERREERRDDRPYYRSRRY